MGLFGGFDLDAIKKQAEDGIKAAEKSVRDADIAKKAQEAAHHVIKDAGEASKNIAGAAGSVSNEATKIVDGASAKIRKRMSATKEPASSGSEAFLRLLYYLAAVDGSVSDAELMKIRDLALSMDDGFDEYEERLSSDCLDRVERDTKEFGRLNATKMAAQYSIENLDLTRREKRLICWNLLAVASSDGLEKDEMSFIEFVCSKMGVDDSDFSELRNYSLALLDLEQERRSLTESNRPYKEIEPLVNEISDRKLVIVEAAQEFVNDYEGV